MTVHNYRSRQVHETLNGVNPSSGFRDMRSAKSGPNLCQIWQVFGPWATPNGANGQMTMTVHNYRPRQFHKTSNGENPSSGYRDMGSANLAAARPPGPWWQYPSSPEGWGVKKPQQNGPVVWLEWCIYASINCTITGSDNGLLSIKTLRNIFQWNFMGNWKVFIQENAYENVVCKNGGHLVSTSIC